MWKDFTDRDLKKGVILHKHFFKKRLQTGVFYQRYLLNDIDVGKIKLLLNNIYFKCNF